MCASTYYRLRIILKDFFLKRLSNLDKFYCKGISRVFLKYTLRNFPKDWRKKPSLASEMEPGLLPALQNFTFKIKITQLGDSLFRLMLFSHKK